MTRARTASYGVVTPPPLDRWIDAVLMLCVSLVQGVATTLGMIFNRIHRDWHTGHAREDLPQATSGISSQGTKRIHGVILGLVPRISVGTPRGLSIDPREAINQDARHKAERDSVDLAPSLSFRTHAQRASRNPGAARTSVTIRSRSRVGNDNDEVKTRARLKGSTHFKSTPPPAAGIAPARLRHRL